MKVDGHVTPILLLVNIYVHGNTWAIFFFNSRPRFFNDSRTFYYYLGRRRWRGCVCGGSSDRRRRLLASGDPE